MKRENAISTTSLALVFAGLLAAALTASATAQTPRPAGVALADPIGDDNGPGTYTYPTDPVYLPGSFDLTKFELIDQGEMIELRVSVSQTIGDPWKSTTWKEGGNGFSLQQAQVYIDMDRKPGSGNKKAIPGLNVAFAPEGAWEKVVVMGPNGKARILGETKWKARDLLGMIVIPTKTWAEGKTIISSVPKSDLGTPDSKWGYQVVLVSNEGYSAPDNFLTRKVDKIAKAHRFGGGDDGNCDPHAIDILAPPARGGPDEVLAQHSILGQYSCGTGGTAEKLAVLPMIYPE